MGLKCCLVAEWLVAGNVGFNDGVFVFSKGLLMGGMDFSQ